MVDSAFQVASRYYDNAIIEPLRQKLIGRQLVYMNPDIKGPGIDNVDVTSLTDMGDASISYARPQPGQTSDMLRLTRSNVKLPKLWKQFEVDRDSWDAWQRKGVQLDASAAVNAAIQVAELEESLIFTGWDDDGDNVKEIAGLYNVTGINSYSTGTHFSTFGNPTIAVTKAKGLILAAGVYASKFNLVLHPTQYTELFASMNATSGILEAPLVKSLLGGGDIYCTTALTDGTGLLLPDDPSRTYMELICPEDMGTSLGMDSRDEKNSNLFGTVLEKMYLNIKYPQALCQMTTI